MHPIVQAIYDRRSIRRFTGEAVADVLLEKMVKAGMAAPSGKNKRPWHFVIVNERASLEVMREVLPMAQMIDKAAAAIVVCGDNTEKYWVEDCSAATQNILLAADAMGYAAVWAAIYPDEPRIAAVRSILNIPSVYTPLCAVPVGVHADVLRVSSAFEPTKLHWNSW